MSKNKTKKGNGTDQQYSELFQQACALLFPPGVTPGPNSTLWADALLLADEMMPEERCD